MARATGSPPATSHEVTYEEFMRMPETHQHVEVVDGVIVVMPGATFKHQIVQGKFFTSLDGYVTRHDLGLVIAAPADVIIRKRPKLQVRQPDVMFFSDLRAGFHAAADPDRLQEEEVKPDLAVEVLSPGQNETPLADKLADYASIQVDEVWFADQAQKSIRVLAREGDGYRLAGEFGPGTRLISRVLPGLDLAVDAIFA
jgi:Uma2 family endonuclease